MDPDLVTIFGFITVITTIVGFTVNGIVQKVLDFKRDQAALRAQGSGNGAKHSQIAERTAHIEDRLAVLERIATDRGQMLSDEIEALRLASRTSERESSQ